MNVKILRIHLFYNADKPHDEDLNYVLKVSLKRTKGQIPIHHIIWWSVVETIPSVNI
jgi:hypothetical protein